MSSTSQFPMTLRLERTLSRISVLAMTTIEIQQSKRGLWRWYWVDKLGKVISVSRRKFEEEQWAWEDAQNKFSLPVTMIYTAGGTDKTFELSTGRPGIRFCAKGKLMLTLTVTPRVSATATRDHSHLNPKPKSKPRPATKRAGRRLDGSRRKPQSA